jgi:thiol-disulfide isomerase/thioredoxin
MKSLNESELAEFLTSRPYSVLHFDACWDGYRKSVNDQIEKVKQQFEDVSFGYVDCDEQQNLAQSIGLRNVPCVAYYNGTELLAAVIGIKQDIAENIRLIKRGEKPDGSNTLSRG